jgi:hypothetical protein
MDFTPHVMYRVRSDKKGEQVIISNLQEQIQFCREEGLVPPTDVITGDALVAATKKIKQIGKEINCKHCNKPFVARVERGSVARTYCSNSCSASEKNKGRTWSAARRSANEKRVSTCLS